MANAPPHTGNCATPLVTSSGLVMAPQNQLRDGGLWMSPCANTSPVIPNSASTMTMALNGLLLIMRGIPSCAMGSVLIGCAATQRLPSLRNVDCTATSTRRDECAILPDLQYRF